MGNPQHYSFEIVDRCNALLGGLWQRVSAGVGARRGDGGPLTTTFLLAMATPMIVFPYERLVQAQRERDETRAGPNRLVADDLDEDAAFATAVNNVLLKNGVQTFSDAPFHTGDSWRYILLTADRSASFNLAEGLAGCDIGELNDPESHGAALALQAVTVISILRNALGHGGVAYASSDGSQIYGGRAEQLIFVSNRTKDKKIIGRHLLRVSEADFHAFLTTWCRWLKDCRFPELRTLVGAA